MGAVRSAHKTYRSYKTSFIWALSFCSIMCARALQPTEPTKLAAPEWIQVRRRSARATPDRASSTNRNGTPMGRSRSPATSRFLSGSELGSHVGPLRGPQRQLVAYPVFSVRARGFG